MASQYTKDYELYKDVKNVFEKSLNSNKNLNDADDIFQHNFQLNVNKSIDLEEACSDFIKCKKICQITLNLFNNYEIYQNLQCGCYNNESNSNSLFNASQIKSDDDRDKPSKSAVVEALYNYVLSYLVIQSLNVSKEPEGISEDIECTMCEIMSPKKDWRKNNWKCIVCLEPLKTTVGIRNRLDNAQEKENLKPVIQVSSQSENELRKEIMEPDINMENKFQNDRNEENNQFSLKNGINEDTGYLTNETNDKNAEMESQKEDISIPENEWKCRYCETVNVNQYVTCKNCFKKPSVDWTCKNCTLVNEETMERCEACGTMNEKSKKCCSICHKEEISCETPGKLIWKEQDEMNKQFWICGKCSKFIDRTKPISSDTHGVYEGNIGGKINPKEEHKGKHKSEYEREWDFCENRNFSKANHSTRIDLYSEHGNMHQHQEHRLKNKYQNVNPTASQSKICTSCKRNDAFYNGVCKTCVTVKWSCYVCHEINYGAAAEYCRHCGIQKNPSKIYGMSIWQKYNDRLRMVWICDNCPTINESGRKNCSGCQRVWCKFCKFINSQGVRKCQKCDGIL